MIYSKSKFNFLSIFKRPLLWNPEKNKHPYQMNQFHNFEWRHVFQRTSGAVKKALMEELTRDIKVSGKKQPLSADLLHWLTYLGRTGWGSRVRTWICQKNACVCVKPIVRSPSFFFSSFPNCVTCTIAWLMLVCGSLYEHTVRNLQPVCVCVCATD